MSVELTWVLDFLNDNSKGHGYAAEVNNTGHITVTRMSDLEPFDPEKADIIGEGSFGIVYRGYLKAKTTGKRRRWPRTEVAIKVLKTVPRDVATQRALIVEMDMAKRARFPSLANVLFLSIEFKRWCIVSICARSSLIHAISSEKNGVSSVWQKEDGELVQWNSTKRAICAFGIAAGICFLHEIGMIHCDIKPENVLLDQDMYPLITDFGFSRVLPEDKVVMTGSVGTPLYMAPEMILGDPVGRPVDVYSYAMLLYELLTLNKPFSDLDTTITFIGLARMVTEGRRPVIPDYVSEDWQTLITRCWAPDPDDRPTMREVVETMNGLDFSLLDDVDENEYDSYRARIYSALGPPKGEK